MSTGSSSGHARLMLVVDREMQTTHGNEKLKSVTAAIQSQLTSNSCRENRACVTAEDCTAFGTAKQSVIMSRSIIVAYPTCSPPQPPNR